MGGSNLRERTESFVLSKHPNLPRLVGKCPLSNAAEQRSLCLVSSAGDARVVFSHGRPKPDGRTFRVLAEAGDCGAVADTFTLNQRGASDLDGIRRGISEPAENRARVALATCADGTS